MSEQLTNVERKSCRVCGSHDLEELFSLGDQFVSGFFETRAAAFSGPRCPIVLDICRNCTLVQNRWTAPQELLYSGHYWYRSGTTATMRAALRDVVESASRLVDLRPGDIVLDIGSNDGTLLNYWPKELDRVGVEPASNFRDGFYGEGLILIPKFWSAGEFFDAQLTGPGGELFDGRVIPLEPKKLAKVVTACGMFYDADDPNTFIADVAKVLHPEGVFVAQLMCLRQTVNANDVGNFCHEHLEFYSLQSLLLMFRRHGLVVFRVEENAVNGGSYRLYARHAANHIPQMPGSEVATNIGKYLDAEQFLHDPDRLREWFRGLEVERDRCVSFIRNRFNAGDEVWVYGASTKGNTILQWMGLTDCMLEGAADKSPEKVGRYMAGSGVKVFSEDEARAQLPDLFLVLPYAFRREFVEREASQEWRTRGGRFIFPLPRFEVV